MIRLAIGLAVGFVLGFAVATVTAPHDAPVTMKSSAPPPPVVEKRPAPVKERVIVSDDDGSAEKKITELQERLRWAGALPLEFPEDIDAKFTEPTFGPAARAALAEHGFELVALDCSEHPCMAYGKLAKPPGYTANLRELSSALRTSTAFALYADAVASHWSVTTPSEVIVGIGFAPPQKAPDVGGLSMAETEERMHLWQTEQDIRRRRESLRQVEAIESLK